MDDDPTGRHFYMSGPTALTVLAPEADAALTVLAPEADAALSVLVDCVPDSLAGAAAVARTVCARTLGLPAPTGPGVVVGPGATAAQREAVEGFAEQFSAD